MIIMIRFYKEGVEVDLVNLGTTELGSTNRVELVMKNDFADKVELLDATVDDSGLKILSANDLNDAAKKIVEAIK